jgi:tRNA uridine 5-carboxymethylaminomethyl modification enzyme
MFTSRAEYRLSLREDNADLRLTEEGRRLGLVDDQRWGRFERKRDAIADELERLKSTWIAPRPVSEPAAADTPASAERGHRAIDLLRRPELSYEQVVALAGGGPGVVDAEVARQVEIQCKYQGYIERQHEEIARHAHHEGLKMPSGIDYCAVHGLSIEVQQKLNQHRPETLGQAGRISGVTPAAVSLLLVHLKRGTNILKSASAGARQRAADEPGSTQQTGSPINAARIDRRGV